MRSTQMPPKQRLHPSLAPYGRQKRSVKAHMQCLVCRSKSRPIKFCSARARICQWCVTLLCEKPIDPDEVIAKFNALIDAHAASVCRPCAPEYYKHQALTKLGYPEHAGFLQSIFNKAAVNKRNADIAALASELLAADVAALNARREAIRESAVQRALGRDGEPKTTTFGYQGWAKTEDLVHPMLVKYINAINLGLLSGATKVDRPDALEWKSLRQLVLEQDRYRCMVCNIYPKEKHVHHIIPISKFGSNHPNNLITLCYKCHDKTHPDIKVTRYAP